MRIGLVSPYDLGRPGGVQHQVLEIGRLLAAAGEAVTVIGPGAKAVADSSYRTIDVGRVQPIKANGSVVPLGLGFDISRRIGEVAAELDVLHVHEPLVPMVGPAALRAGRPVVATFHALPPNWISVAYRVGPPRWLRGRWFGRAVLTAVSAEAARGPLALGPVRVIPNGLDVSSYGQGAARVPGRVVFLGRDEPRKGLAVLIDAWPIVSWSHPDASLVIVGAGDPHGPGSPVARVEYRGFVSEGEKRRLLGESSIMVAPNLGGESFGLVVVEAMASGCAVIASDIPAFRAVIGGAGELVPAGKAIELGQAIARLLSEPSRIAALALAARGRASDFDWSRVLPQYRAEYQRAIDQGVGSHRSSLDRP
jgi:phosphatidylinositol alpha-mannosyltransferase